jgi:hypothetical protein
MSQSIPPFNQPDQHPPDPSQPRIEAPSSWRDPFTGMDEEEDSEVDFLVGSLAEIEMTGTDEAIGSVEFAAIALTPKDKMPKENGSEASLHPTEPPEVADLVSLIQELNQCNSALLDRVSQLEEALEQSHSALPSIESTEPKPQNLFQAQEQITTLYNQLEFAHQTNQRQQILLETLTDQLEASQERVAQLERETSLLQQRYTEQSQVLAQTEGNCRDLQTRLYRQQRYTLQFKAALEKCLEVPVPQYEGQDLPSAQTAGDYLFLPKAQRIKPWAAQSDAMPGKLPWMNITPGLLDNSQPEDAQAEFQPSENLNLPTFALPKLEAPQASSVQSGSKPSAEVRVEEAHCSADTARVAPPAIDPQSESTIDSLGDDPALMAHISSIVQPLADLIAEAMLAEPFPVDALQPAIAPPAVPPVVVPAASEFTSELANELMSEPAQSSAQPPAQPVVTELNEVPLPEVPMADAEDALWQDLARLIDVSTEDVVKASLSGDFAAFEAIDFSALENAASPTSVEQDPWDVPTAPPQTTSSQAISPKVLLSMPAPKSQPVKAPAQKTVQSPTIRQPAAVQPPLNPMPQSSVPAFVANSQNSPSPLVYPLRPLKKRQSLAMVELPDFNKQPSSPVSN